ncbi:MAG: transposase [Desulfotignum sp.]
MPKVVEQSMPRKKRVWYPGAKYHIVTRGVRQSLLFKGEEDYRACLSIINQVRQEYPFKISSYCLMPNHIHLQLITIEIEIWKIMQKLKHWYARYFNNKYNFTGHLYQGRYHAELIERDRYNLHVSKYIHLNPVKAGMAARAEDYPWSSYQVYLGQRPSRMVAPEDILAYFSPHSIQAYQKYVESPEPPDFSPEIEL